MSEEEDILAQAVRDIVSDASASLAGAVSAGARLGAMLAGVHRGLVQGGASAHVAMEVTKTVAEAAFRKI